MRKRMNIGSLACLLTLGALASIGAAPGWAATGAPTVKHLTPSSGSVNGGTPVHVSGSGLAPVAERCVAADIAKCKVTVRFGGKEATVLFDSPHNAVVIAPAVAQSKTVDVTVEMAGKKSATSPADRFAYTEPGEELEEKLGEAEEQGKGNPLKPLEEGLEKAKAPGEGNPLEGTPLEEAVGELEEQGEGNPLREGQRQLEEKLGELPGGEMPGL